MGEIRIYSFHLTDGTVIPCRKPYNYFDHGSIIDSIEKAKDDDIITVRDAYGEELLIPKKKILFVKIGLEETAEDDNEVV